MCELDLFNDMIKRFKVGEIKSFLAYEQLLKSNFRDTAYYKVSRNPNLFEREINKCLVELEENL